MPRPDDTDILEAIRRDLIQGLPLGAAAIRANISDQTAYQWLQAGSAILANEPNAKALRRAEPGSVATFARMVKESLAECQAQRLAAVDQAEGNNWQKHMTVLERRFPSEWGRNQRIEVESRSTVTYVHELGPGALQAIATRMLETNHTAPETPTTHLLPPAPSDSQL